MKIGQDDGFGNIVKRLVFPNYYDGDGDNTIIGRLQRGDIVYIHNKEGCRIATYKVW